MERRKVEGVISSTDKGKEASIAIAVGDYQVALFVDDSCGSGKGFIRRSSLKAYHQNERPSESQLTKEIFGVDEVLDAGSEELYKAIEYCKKLSK